MEDDNYYLNILSYGIPSGTIAITPHPEEIIDVDPRVIQSMKERLAKSEKVNYGNFNLLDLEREKQKLKLIINSENALIESFSSVKNITEFESKLCAQNVNKKLLYEYSYYLSKQETVDAFDFYRHFIFRTKLRTKDERVKSHRLNKALDLLDELLAHYRLKHFDILKVTKEIINVNLNIRYLFETRKLLPKLDKYLSDFYLNS
jgi:hypothetical protein